MNEHEQIEQSLLRLTPRKTPTGLRGNVLNAIDHQRKSESQDCVTTANVDGRRWLATLDRVATFAAPSLLAISLLMFFLVNRSVSKLYGGHHDFVSQGRVVAKDSAFGKQNPLMTPQEFFRQHLAILQKLNAELVSETPKKVPQVDRDRSPLGHFHCDPDYHISDLACKSPSRGTSSTIT